MQVNIYYGGKLYWLTGSELDIVKVVINLIAITGCSGDGNSQRNLIYRYMKMIYNRIVKKNMEWDAKC